MLYQFSGICQGCELAAALAGIRHGADVGISGSDVSASILRQIVGGNGGRATVEFNIAGLSIPGEEAKGEHGHIVFGTCANEERATGFRLALPGELHGRHEVVSLDDEALVVELLSEVAFTDVESDPVVQAGHFAIFQFADEDVLEGGRVRYAFSSGVMIEPHHLDGILQRIRIFCQWVIFLTQQVGEHSPGFASEDCVDEVDHIGFGLVIVGLGNTGLWAEVAEHFDERLKSGPAQDVHLHVFEQPIRRIVLGVLGGGVSLVVDFYTLGNCGIISATESLREFQDLGIGQNQRWR
jgi:hypothetical protein